MFKSKENWDVVRVYVNKVMSIMHLCIQFVQKVLLELRSDATVLTFN